MESINSKNFLEKGYAILSGALSPEDIAAAKDEISIFEKLVSQNHADIFSNYYLSHRVDQGVLYDLYQRNPVFRRLTEGHKILDFIAEIYAEEFYLFENSLVYKPKNSANEVPWHQDYMYMTNDPDKVICWIAIDDVDESNGCIYAIPGSHAQGALPWSEVVGQTHAKRTAAQYVKDENAIPLRLKAGDMLCFHQFLLHSSQKTSGEILRRAYRFAVKSFANSYVPRGSPIVLRYKSDNSALLNPFVGPRNGVRLRCVKHLRGLASRIEKTLK